MDNQIIEACARAAHEANRAFCIAIGDTSQVSWDEASESDRRSTMNSIRGIFAGDTPVSLHATWSKEKVDTGWTFGPVKNAAEKKHPCLVDYSELPVQQRAKDDVYHAVVVAMRDALKRASQ